MKNKITYLNCVLTVIAIALTVIVLQNAGLISTAKAAPQPGVMDVNIKKVGGFPIFPGEGIPVKIKN